jgi:hypothetical protein
MHSRTAGSQLVSLCSLCVLALLSLCLPATPADAEMVPFNCIILPGEDAASIRITNALDSEATCIVTCTFSSVKGDNSPQIACAKPVPAGKEIEMCRLPSGDKLVKLTEGRAECTKLTRPR